jgi:amino acid adenylation domain-containing protein
VEKENKAIIEGFRLSPQQSRLWLLQQDSQASPYYAQSTVLLEGKLNAQMLKAALDRLVQRHEILRTTFRCLPAMALPLQVIAEKGQVPLQYYDLSDWEERAQEGRIEALLDEVARHSFDFERGPLWQILLVKLAPEKHLLVFRLPALCADRAGLEALVRELSLCYAVVSGEEGLLAEPMQYADLAQWQNELLESEETETGREYWRRQPRADLLAIKLPFENRRPLIKLPGADQAAEKAIGGAPAPGRFAPQSLSRLVEPDQVRKVEALAQQVGTSVSVVFLACWQILLWRLTGQTDILIGTAYDGRNYEELQGALGLFQRYLPISCHLEEHFTFDEVLKRLDEMTCEANTWQECFTWEQIAGPNGHCNVNSFFPYCFEYAPEPARFSSGELSFTITECSSCTDRFKLKLTAAHQAEAVKLTFHFDAELFAWEELQPLAEQYLSLLAEAVSHPQTRLIKLPLLSPEARGRLLGEIRGAVGRYGPGRPIHHLFEEQAELKPEAVAVVVEEQQLSYGELNRRANRVAHYLQELGVGPEVLVGLCLERSVELLVGMMGILKAGGAYLPLDPVLPVGRLGAIIAGAGPKVVLTQEALLERLPETEAVVVCLDRDEEQINRGSAEDVVSEVRPENLVYVLFTSGSTGEPKGVGVEHRQLYNYVCGVRERLELGEGASYATVTSYGSDLGNTAIFPALCSGGCVHLVKAERASDGAALGEYMRRHQVDCLKIVPSHLRAVLGGGVGGEVLPRRRLVLGGEALSWELVRVVKGLAPGCEVFNHYGPTETTVGVLSGAVEGAERGGVPLGWPLGNVRVYVLDREMEVVPVWVEGEIYIAGAQVTRGYLKLPEQTAEVYLPDPYSEVGGERMYRSGDMGRYLPDGRVEFLGRRDEQVKVRGYRVELGEIEGVLKRHRGVEQSVVVVRERGEGDKEMVGYVVAKGGVELSGGELLKWVRERLPEYMVPAAIVVLERIPLTANGKVDRGALPEPERGAGVGGYVAPRTQVEEIVAGIWAEVLGAERVGIHDDFFELGGHSLLITRVAARVSSAFQVELPFQIFFEKRTIAELAESIEAAHRGEQGLQIPPMLPIPRDGELPLSFAQQRLWFFDQLEPNSPAYNIPGAVRLTGQLDVRAMEQTLSEIVRRHEILRTIFPTVNGRPVQVVTEAQPLSLPVVVLSELSPEEREIEAQRLVMEEIRRPFKLAQGPLLRVGLLRLSEADHILFFTLHHIISDAWSMVVLVREVATLYEAFSTGEASPLAELKLQYADFAYWQRQWLQGEVLERQLSYWRQQLAAIPPALQLPTDRPRPAVQTTCGEGQELELSKEVSEALRALSRREGATLFMTLLAAFKALLHYYTAQDDMVVGTNVANRTHIGTEGLIGFFVNQLVLRTDLSGNPTFRELLARVRRVALAAYAHQDLPFEKLVEELQPQRDMSRSLLFQVKFELREGITQSIELPGLTIIPLESGYKVARYDLHLSMAEGEQGLAGILVYNADLFEASTIDRMISDFVALLERVATEPDVRLSELAELLAEKNKQQQLLKEKELEEATLKKLKALRRKVVEV